MDHRLKTFTDEACRQFDFLVAEHDLAGPLREPVAASDRRPLSLEVRYVSPSLTVTAALILGFGGEEEVDTGLVLRTADERIAAGVHQVAVAAGLGPAQRISRSARTATQMRGSLAAQAAALRQLVPLLDGEAGAVKPNHARPASTTRRRRRVRSRTLRPSSPSTPSGRVHAADRGQLVRDAVSGHPAPPARNPA